MMDKVKRKVLSFLLCVALIGNIFPVNSVAAERDVYALTYHVGAYDMFPESDGNISVMIDGKKYYYSDDFDNGEIATKISKMENQNVVYELHDNKIVEVYTMDEVLSQEVTVEPSVEDGLIYRKGKFSQESFELVIKVSNNLQGDFQKNDLLWFLSDSEKNCLYSTLKKLEIKPSDKVDFGTSGWWMWKEYEETISENMNAVIRAEETKEYKYTVNLHNDGVVNQREYNIVLYATPTFDTGVGRRVEGKIPVGNLDYQEEKTEEKKATSNAGQSVAQASTKLDGIKNAIQFSKDFFSTDQINQINEFVNIWMSELLLAKYVDKSDLKEKVSEKIANQLLKKLGLDTSVLAIPGEIQATTYLETQTKDGSRVFIQFNINLLNFDFGNSGMPTMATGSGTATIYNMDGEELDSSVILPVYANVCAFCEQLQKVAKDTIFSGAKEYLGIFGISAESTAEAMSSQIMAKVLNNKYAKDVFKMVDAKDMKKALKKIIVNGEKTVNKKIFKLITTPSQGNTEVSVKCPVDVKIYDNDGNLCGVVKDNVVDSAYDDIFVTVVGDQKNIYLVGDDYSFEMTGTDEGAMDYVVREFDDGGNKTREITYENIELSNGCKYYSYVPEAANHSSVLFDLTDSEGNIISPTTGSDAGVNIDSIDGKCGESVYWELSENGILRIYGNGNMQKSGFGEPWSIYKEQITSVVIEDGVTSVFELAFADLTYLENVVIGNGVTEIEYGAFTRCTSLSSIIIPDSVSIIDGAVFMDCTSLSSVTIGKGVKSVGRLAFNGCNHLAKTNYTGTVDQWAEIEFGDDTANASDSNPIYHSRNLYINDKLVTNIELIKAKKISDYAFNNCDSIQNIVIGNEVTSIGDGAFYQCTSLKDITIGNGVTNIGTYAFADCTSLQNVTIGNGVISIGYNTFDGCTNLLKTNYTGTINQWVEINFELSFGKLPTSNPVFYSKNLHINDVLAKDIELNGVKKISDYAFYGCLSLTNVTIGNEVTDIGVGAFHSCTGLSNIVVSDSVTSIAKLAFFECSNLTNIAIGNNVTDIGDSAFYGCAGLSSIIIPDSVINIGEYAFEKCTNLLNVEIGSGLVNLGKGAFWGCPNIEKVVIYSKVLNEIPGGCFQGDWDSGRYNMEIWGYAGTAAQLHCLNNANNIACNIIFKDLDNNNQPTVTASPKPTNKTDATGNPKPTNEPNATEDTKPTDGTNTTNSPSAGTVLEDSKNKVSYKVTAQGKAVAFYKVNDKKEAKITIPSTVSINGIKYKVTTISDNAFSGCKKLKSVTIGEHVATIGNKAFFKCTSLKKITIPAEIRKIGKQSLYGCKNLKNITIKTTRLTKKNIGNKAFKGIYSKVNIKVPKSKLKSYKKFLRAKGVGKRAKIHT